MSDDVRPRTKALFRTLFAAALVATSLSPLCRSRHRPSNRTRRSRTSSSSSATTSVRSNISAYTHGRGGLQDAQHRPHRQRRHDVHRLLRREQLHGGPLDLHHRPGLPAHRALQGRHSRRDGRACRTATSRSPRRSSRSATRPASSARTISATATNICRPSTASTSSSATSTTSMPRRSRSGPTIPKNDATFVKANSPRGVLKASADGKIEDTGPLNRKRMETVDDETTAAAIDFMQRQAQGQQAVLHLDEHHPHARLHPCARVDAGPERHARQ